MIKISRIILVVVAVLTVVFAYFIGNGMKMDYRYETFFPKDDPELEYFEKFRKQFGSENDYLLIAIENHAGIFNEVFLKKVKALSDSIAALKNITQVISPVRGLNYYQSSSFVGLEEKPYLHWDNPQYYAADSLRIFSNKELVGTFFSNDRKALCIYVKTKDKIAKAPSDNLLAELNVLYQRFAFDELHDVSKIKAQAHYVNKLGNTLAISIVSSVALLIVVLWFSFQSVSALLIPLLTVVVSLIWTLAIMYFCGKDMDMLSSLLPTMIFIVGMSDVVHILTNYIEELRDGHTKEVAIKKTIKEVGFATFLTCASTSIGFFTLITANIEPIRDFGLYTGIGVFIAFLLSFLLLPSVFLNTKIPKIVANQGNNTKWQNGLRWCLQTSIKYPKQILVISGLLTLLSFAALFLIKIDNHLLEDLPENDPIRQDFNYLETKFSGVRPLEVVIEIKDSSSVFDYAVLKQIDVLEKFMIQNYQMGFVLSPLKIIKEANKADHGANHKFYKLPETPENYNQLKEKLETFGVFQQVKIHGNQFVSANGKTFRISGKIPDYGGRKLKKMHADFDAYFKAHLNTSILTYHLTGTAHLIDLNNESLSKNMINGLWLSLAFIALIVGWLFKSLRMILICLIPNIIPGFFVAGFMGIANIEMRISTSIIFSIAFGIAVDDTIHIISRLKLELSKGKSFLYALKRTYLSTGKAVVVTSFILSAGFLTLVFSQFSSTFYIGVLVSLTLLIAVICELFLLPVLLIFFYRKKRL